MVMVRNCRLFSAAAVLVAAGALHAQEQSGHAPNTAAHSHHGAKGASARAGLGSSALFAPDGSLWLVGVDERRRLFVVTSKDTGRTWSHPRTIDTGSDQPSADGDSRPKLAFGPRGQVVIAYTQPLAKPYTGNIRMVRSVDRGRTFLRPVTVHHDGQVITHRFESILFDAQGRLHVVWVDKRDAERARAAAGASKSRYAGAAIYRTVSNDGGARFAPDIKLADHSCECCRIVLAAEPGGAVVALWRHVFGDNVRDHAFARIEPSARQSTEPVRATFDDWKVDACPHHGPGLTRALDGGFHAVWFGERAGLAAVRYSRLAADGQPVGPALELPDEMAEHADILSAGKHLAIVWRSFDGKATRLRAQVSDDDGQTFELRELADSGDDNDHPRLARRGDRIFCVWRNKDEIRVFPL